MQRNFSFWKNPFRNVSYQLLNYPLYNAELTVLTHRIDPKSLENGLIYKGFFSNYQCLWSKIQTKGIGSLYFGFIPFMFAKCEGELSEFISRYLESSGFKPHQDSDANQGYNLIDFFLCTLVSEFVPATIVNPINTLLLRLVCDDENKKYFTFADCFFDILRNEGFLEGFYHGICYKLGYKLIKVVFSTIQYKYKLREDFGSPTWSTPSFMVVLLRTLISRPFAGLAGWRMFGYRGSIRDKLNDFDSLFISDQNLQIVLLDGVLSFFGSMIFD